MTEQSKHSDTTHFGYREVPVDEKADRVADVFHSVAGKYDIMNDLLSMGIHRVWKRFTIDLANLRSGEKVLDLASGTADLAMKMKQKIGDSGEIFVTDINESMLDIGRRHMIDAGFIKNINYMFSCFNEIFFMRMFQTEIGNLFSRKSL